MSPKPFSLGTTLAVPGLILIMLAGLLLVRDSARALTALISAQVNVAGPPAQVLINSVTASLVPNVTANVTISNEGLTAFEYDYEWCVVVLLSNECGGGDDIYYASAAKLLDPGEDWNTNLSATVPTPGTYFFRLKVFFGGDFSEATRNFSLTTGGGGGGGGGGGSTPPTSPPTIVVPPTELPEPEPTQCQGADFNHDGRVNSVDFSILLAFWKTSPPFRNPCVDINKDNNVNSVDFSILLFEWSR